MIGRRSVAIIVFLLGFSAPIFGEAFDLGKHCTSEDTVSFERPFYPENKLGPHFQYRFKWIRSRDPQGITLIYIPGGPGLTSMEESDSRYPSSFNVILTDPRGLGCNQTPARSNPPDFYSTRQIASDIVDIIRRLKLDRYILYGISYGTMVATVAADQTQKEGLPLPKAVVLEGVVGHAAGTLAAQGYLDQWRRVRQNLEQTHPKIMERLSQKLPLGVSSDVWGTAIQYLLLGGRIPLKTQGIERIVSRLGFHSFTIESVLALLEPGIFTVPDFILKQGLHKLAAEWGAPSSAEKEKLYQQIVCREYSDQVTTASGDIQLKLLQGNLVASNIPFCKELTLDRPYRSSDYQVQSPLIYFQGKWDPSTPDSQAWDHYLGQKKTTSKIYVSVQEGGHGALSYNLRDCEKEIWKQIDLDFTQISKALSGCSLKAKIDRL